MDEEEDSPIVVDDQPAIELVDVVIPDDFEIVPDDIVPDDPDEAEEEEDSDKKPIFGYDITLNEDGTLKQQEVILTKDIIRNGLSHVARTLDTFEFAYSRYEGRNKSLTNIDVLENYVYLRVIDLTKNQIESCKALSTVKHLMVLVMTDNLIETMDVIPDLPFLQALSLAGNKLKHTEGLFPNCLTYLQLSFNKIESLRGLDDETYPWLSVLELRGNCLTTLDGLKLPSLDRLFVADNDLISIGGLAGCPKLTHFHARDNQISKLDDFPFLELLEYVNLRNNKLKRFAETKHLGNSPNIKTLICMKNPISESENYRKELISANLNLKRLDKEPVTEIDLIEGRQIRNGRENGTVPEVEDDPILQTPPSGGLPEGYPDEYEGEGYDPMNPRPSSSPNVPETTPLTEAQEKKQVNNNESEEGMALKTMNLKKGSQQQ